MFVDDGRVFIPDDSRHRLRERIGGEIARSFLTSHEPPGPVRAGLITRGITLAANDVGLRTHAPGNDTEIASAGANSTLTSDMRIPPIVVLQRDVVVVAVDCF